MDKKRVVLGYSGGVDSAAAVALLQQQGFEVVALTLDMCDDSQLVESARERAAQAGITFDTLNCEELFEREIKQYFADEYMRGRTPAPCTRCNPLIKWRLLSEYAAANNIYHIATGHYFRIEKLGDKYYVARAKDRRKDQSYYLWGVPQELLARAVTPMADIVKAEINSAGRSESMGVCFLAGRKYSEYISEVCPNAAAGNILDLQGAVVGQHRGLAYYTVGQKRGEGIPAGSVIIALDNECNSLIIGEDAQLYHTILFINECNIVDEDELLTSNDISVMIRGIGRNPEGFASRVEPHGEGYKITLSSAAWACAAGQPVVLYRGDRVIGGGYLDRSMP